MNRPFNKFLATWVAVIVLAVVVVVRFCQFEFLERLERYTYDLRARAALHFPSPAATNLAFVEIAESSLVAVQNNPELDFHHASFPWPRHIYGRLVHELTAEGVKAVAFDILYGELHPDHDPVLLPDGSEMDSDAYFAEAMRQGTDTFIAATPDVVPPDLFRTNCLAMGDVSTEKDPDGILRRICAFRTIRHWHPFFQQLAMNPDYSADLANARFVPGKILLPQGATTNVIEVPVDAENNFRLADFGGQPGPGEAATAKAFTEERLWQLGIVLAARELNLDLAHARVDLPHGRITLTGPNGVERVIPVDANGYFYLDWRMESGDPILSGQLVENLLLQSRRREAGQTNDLVDWARGRLVVVGSAVLGNNLSDRGATPLENNTLLVSTHWNVANAVINQQFIHQVPLPMELAIICLLGAATASMTMRFRTVPATVAVLVVLLPGYLLLAVFLYVRFRLWLPMVYPMLGAGIALFTAMTILRVIFEQGEKRRVRSVFAKMVSPEIVNELLQSDKLAVGGRREEVTVLFADIRGFTTLTDQMQERVAEFVREHGLAGAAAEECFNESAAETLDTVNQYLAVVAEAVIRHNGTLDKYIGDCVMAFWNAPVPNGRHALDSVLAAIAAQRAIVALNEKRLALNPAREVLNAERVAAGRPPLPLHTPLQLGTGINTGLVVVGLMGSDEHGFNFTVFGREVNLASRLESVSGSGRIIISEVTYEQVRRADPELAARCVSLPAEKVKGIREAVKIYEVPWQVPG